VQVTDPQHLGFAALPDRWWTERAPSGEFWGLAMAALLINFGVPVYYLSRQPPDARPGISGKSLGLLAGAIPIGIVARRYYVARTCLGVVPDARPASDSCHSLTDVIQRPGAGLTLCHGN